ncbi:MAG: 3'-5' exonuclease [Verrucomicrobiota bacterium]
MNLLIADTFTDSLAQLTPEEQKATKLTVVDFQLNPENPGHSFHRIERSKDKDFWSVRINRDLRLIVHKRGKNLLVCYCDHHDKAYAWAQNRRLENHPKTGVAQIVQIRETIRDIEIPNYVAAEKPAPTATEDAPKTFPFQEYSDDDLLEWGVPADWLDDVRKADDNQLLELADHLPAEASDVLLELATGGSPSMPEPATTEDEAFSHPDALRRFQIITSDKELEAALEFPWDKWSVFLHPDQRRTVERSFNGPARVSGSAGTGKTIVALHRAVHLARKFEDFRILLTTFSEPLAKALLNKLRILVYSEPRLIERIHVDNLGSLAKRLYRLRFGDAKIAPEELIEGWIDEAHPGASTEVRKFSPRFLKDEWNHVVDAHQLKSLDDYRDVSRLGRRSRLAESQRESLWPFFQSILDRLLEDQKITEAGAYTALANHIAENGSPYEHAIVDESQDLSVSQLKFFASLGGGHPESLFFAGDIGQRIFQKPISWLAHGIDIRGRSSTLRVNYRTSHQIRSQADQLLEQELKDPDGNKEVRNHTVSVFNGPRPSIAIADSPEEESEILRNWLSSQEKIGIEKNEIGIIVRSSAELAYARERLGSEQSEARVFTMHEAKGLEFRSVAVVGCNEKIVPLEERIELASDLPDLQAIHDSERHLLYVACTRTRENLLVTALAPGSEFLADLA